LTRRGDIAFVAETAPTPPAVAPVSGLINNTPAIVSGGVVADSLDELVDLVAALQNNLATPTHIVMDPLGWAEFRKLKVGATYNASLIGAGTSDAQQLLLSLPVLVNVGVPDYTGVVVDRTAIVSAGTIALTVFPAVSISRFRPPGNGRRASINTFPAMRSLCGRRGASGMWWCGRTGSGSSPSTAAAVSTPAAPRRQRHPESAPLH
jgi:hypothetical protein